MSYNGTTYKNDMIVIVGKHDNGYETEKIMIIIIHKDKHVYFMGETYQMTYLVKSGLYCVLPTKEKRVICVSADDLLDYYPLPVYHKDGLMIVCLHHSVQS